MGDDVGARLVPEPHRTAVVVGMRMGDDDRVHVGHQIAGPAEAVDERSLGLVTRKTGIDHRRAVLVLQQTAVHMAETRHGDRQLTTQNPVRHLGDLGRRILLLLLVRSWWTRRVRALVACVIGVVRVVVAVVAHAGLPSCSIGRRRSGSADRRDIRPKGAECT